MTKNRFSIMSLIGGIALLGGCATTGGGFLNTNVPADAGSAPTHYEAIIKNHLQGALKDPNSLIDLSISEPILTSCSIGIYGPFNGWRVTTSYNAKNSYGGYVGLQTYYYWFHGARLKGIGRDASFCPEASGWL